MKAAALRLANALAIAVALTLIAKLGADLLTAQTIHQATAAMNSAQLRAHAEMLERRTHEWGRGLAALAMGHPVAIGPRALRCTAVDVDTGAR